MALALRKGEKARSALGFVKRSLSKLFEHLF
jgi:hypothetical protein